MATRTSEAARLRLSVRHSMRTATPFGPYPSYMIVRYSAPPASAPDPRFHARSMLSLGTDDFFAFWMASYSVGLPAGSPPPVRAATSMFLISLANSLLRLASTTAFLCLVVAHLEWPLIGSSALSPSRRSTRARAGPRSAQGGRTWPAGGPAGRRRSYRRPARPRRGRAPRRPARCPPPRALG